MFSLYAAWGWGRVGEGLRGDDVLGRREMVVVLLGNLKGFLLAYFQCDLANKTVMGGTSDWEFFWEPRLDRGLDNVFVSGVA